MKRKMKIPLMVFCVLAALVLIDTLQAKALDRVPILKAVEDYNGGDLYQKHKGILADTYVFTDGSQKTVFKWEKIDTNMEDIMMDLPIPTHLQPFFTVIGDKNDEHSVTGTVHCSCGCEQFEVWESNDRGLVKLVCRKCGKEITVLDSGRHGWDGFVCKLDFLDRTQPLRKYTCPKCGQDAFEVCVMIHSLGKQDFQDFLDKQVSENESFTIDDWVNGFDWITIAIACADCSYLDGCWVSLETM